MVRYGSSIYYRGYPALGIPIFFLQKAFLQIEGQGTSELPATTRTLVLGTTSRAKRGWDRICWDREMHARVKTHSVEGPRSQSTTAS